MPSTNVGCGDIQELPNGKIIAGNTNLPPLVSEEKIEGLTPAQWVNGEILSLEVEAHQCVLCRRLWLRKLAADLCCHEGKMAIKKKVEDAQ
jgi:hypothetical protein